MRDFSIRLSVIDLRNYSITLGTKLNDENLTIVLNKFSEYLIALYGTLIENAINSSRYKGDWEPIDDEEYRKYIGTNPRKSLILPLMKASLIYDKRGYFYVIRFDEDLKYPGSELSVLDVLRAIEYGTSKFHARPIIRKACNLIKSNVRRLWKGFLTMKGLI